MSPRPRPLNLPTADIAAAAIVAALGFLVNFGIALHWSNLGTFDQINVFFAADPAFYVERLGHGWGPFTLKHMNVITFFNPPVRVLAEMLSALGAGQSKLELRESLTLLIVPGLGVVKTLALFAVFRSLMLSRSHAVLLCVLDIFSFSRIVFGSMPESFAISGALIAVMYWAAVRTPRHRGRRDVLLWLVLTTVAVGVTVTNVMSAAPLLLVDGWRAGNKGVALVARVAGILALALAINVGLATGASLVYNGSSANLTYDPGGDPWVGIKPPTAVRELRYALTNTLLAPRPGVVPDTAPGQRYAFMFSFAEAGGYGWSQVIAAVTTLLVCAGGAILGARVRAMRVLMAASLAIVLANFLMHLVFGEEFFLYSQHWQVSLLMFVAGWAVLPRRAVAFGVIGLFTLAVIVTSLAHVRWMAETLSRP